MKIEIKKILTEDFDLNQNYISPMVQNELEYDKASDKHVQMHNAYNNLIDRGLNSDERTALINGINNLNRTNLEPIDPKALSTMLIKDNEIINNYRMQDSNNLYNKALDNNYDRGNAFRERESDLRKDIIDQKSNIAHLNHKLENAKNDIIMANSRGDLKAGIYGTAGLLGGGLLGSTVGGIYMANKLKNRNQR